MVKSVRIGYKRILWVGETWLHRYVKIARSGVFRVSDNEAERDRLLKMYAIAKNMYISIKRMLMGFPCKKCGLYHDIEEPCGTRT